MPSDDLSIANQSFPATRSDINSNLQALGTLMSGSSAPATTYAYMWWADTTNGVLKQRDAANSAWIIRATLSDDRVVTKTGAYTVALGDMGKTILCSASGGAFTITLPAAATAGDGFFVAIKKTDSTALVVTLDGNGSETIDGATTMALGQQYDGVVIVCDGSNWLTIDKYLQREYTNKTTLTSNTTIDATYHGRQARIDCTSGNVVITLPTTPGAGFRCDFIRMDASANSIALTPTSGTINGFGTLYLRSQYERCSLFFDGTNYIITSHDGKKRQLVTLTSGTSWSVPSDVRSLFRVRGIGGGGGGAGAQTNQASAGGSTGARFESYNFSVTPGGTVTYAIGAAGTGGSAGNNNGTAGGNTTFGGITATGGAYGFSNGTSQQTAAGSGADYNWAGATGQSASPAASMAGGSGASSEYGGGGTGAPGGGGGGTGYGAGGGGASNNTAGGAGTAGIIIIEYFGGE